MKFFNDIVLARCYNELEIFDGFNIFLTLSKYLFKKYI